jgi:hypothetical protein
MKKTRDRSCHRRRILNLLIEFSKVGIDKERIGTDETKTNNPNTIEGEGKWNTNP